jgi:hypothetical protein
MFASIDRSPKRRNRAVTLIEAVLYISIALALIVGGLVFFQQASTAAKTNTLVRHISAIVAESRVLIKGLPVTGPPVPGSGPAVTQILIAAGAVPSDMVLSPTELSNPFGGRMILTAGVTGFPPAFDQILAIDLSNIPQGVCARLLAASSGTSYNAMPMSGSRGVGFTNLASSGIIMSGAFDPTEGSRMVRNYVMNPTQAGRMCKYGSNRYDPTRDPTSAPLPENVDVTLWILINA